MTLPDFLEADDGGFIHLTGHRIGLHHLVRMYADGSSPEMIAAHYPSLPLALIHRVIAFYLENQSDVEAMVTAHDAEIAREIAAGPMAPSVVQLRQRMQKMGAATSNSG